MSRRRNIDVDRFGPDLGPRMRIEGPEHALELVRSIHPRARMEGSTGAERTWIAADSEGVDRVIGHHWSPSTGIEGRPWWLRIAADAEKAPLWRLG